LICRESLTQCPESLFSLVSRSLASGHPRFIPSTVHIASSELPCWEARNHCVLWVTSPLSASCFQLTDYMYLSASLSAGLNGMVWRCLLYQ
jgi:hypothetical protein